MNIHDLTYSSAAPLVLSSEDPDATVWTSEGKAPQVIMKPVGDWCWFEVSGVASYRFPASSSDRSVRCEAFPSNGVPPAVVEDIYYRSVVPVALQVYGLESMHGTALAYEWGAVVLCAPSRTGKSTLTFALAAKGGRIVADDGVVWEAHEGVGAGVDLHPIPFSLMLREASATHFNAKPRELVRVDQRHLRAVAVEPVPIRAVLLLDRQEGAALTSTRLSQKEAFTRLLAPSYALSLGQKWRKGRMMAAYLRFASAVPVHVLTYPSGLDRLTEVVERIEAITAEQVGVVER